jgi:hypothetical protein
MSAMYKIFPVEHMHVHLSFFLIICLHASRPGYVTCVNLLAEKCRICVLIADFINEMSKNTVVKRARIEP